MESDVGSVSGSEVRWAVRAGFAGSRSRQPKYSLNNVLTASDHTTIDDYHNSACGSRVSALV